MASENKEEKLGSGEENIVEVLEPKEKSSKKILDNNSSTKPILWEQFSNWIHCICVVTFDLELGQAIEVRTAIICFYLELRFGSLQYVT